MAHGAAHDAADDIAPALVRRQHAIGDEEARRAQMVGDDAVARPVLAFGLDAGRLFRRPDQGAKQVDVVIVVLALQHRRNALEPHAGVDRRARQVDALFLRDLLELHEDEVPYLDETIAVLVRAAGRAARNVFAMIVEDLRARAARSCIAHRPEIVAGRDADDAALREPGDLLPVARGIVVGVVDGDGQAVLGKPELLGDQVPGKLDRALLEIVAERKIAEHLEEGVVAGGVADIVEVIVLAAGAHAFLRGRGARIGPLLQPGEDVLELHHAGIGEHQRRVVARHQRARRHDLVTVLLEIVEKRRPDFVHATHAVAFFEGDSAAQIRPQTDMAL